MKTTLLGTRPYGEIFPVGYIYIYQPHKLIPQHTLVAHGNK